MSDKEEEFEPNVDLFCAPRQLWLVKVPKYLAKRLQSSKPLQEIGRIKINGMETDSQMISFNLSEEMAKNGVFDNKENEDFVSIEHKFQISSVESQTISIFSENHKTNQICIEGSVTQKGEFRPIFSENYITLNKERVKLRSQPLRKVKQLDRTVTVFKPMANVSKVTKNISPIKKCKKDKESVRNMLFELFGKHQFYKIGDLERLTLQPVYYLKEVLREMCVYNPNGKHKYMWELRPEFRHYTNDNKN